MANLLLPPPTPSSRPAAEYWQGEKRDDYQPSDVQDYFMYMGMLASEVGGLRRCWFWSVLRLRT